MNIMILLKEPFVDEIVTPFALAAIWAWCSVKAKALRNKNLHCKPKIKEIIMDKF
ncbi:hypothetical protein Fmac_025006 [Flemingia macrophylla]|uniref:Uncharacterized protein n=1 Tax=Flemingia macrophylla TaxID=520843 RepID=A0ABD1LQZ3_9FABA